MYVPELKAPFLCHSRSVYQSNLCFQLASSFLDLPPGNYYVIPCANNLAEDVIVDFTVRSETVFSLHPLTYCFNSCWINENATDSPRLELLSSENAHVRLSLFVPPNAPPPALHVWCNRKLINGLEISYSNGELSASLSIEADKLYYIGTSSSGSDYLGPFRLLVASPQEIEIKSSLGTAVPARLDLNSYSRPGVNNKFSPLSSSPLFSLAPSSTSPPLPNALSSSSTPPRAESALNLQDNRGTASPTLNSRPSGLFAQGCNKSIPIASFDNCTSGSEEELKDAQLETDSAASPAQEPSPYLPDAITRSKSVGITFNIGSSSSYDAPKDFSNDAPKTGLSFSTGGGSKHPTWRNNDQHLIYLSKPTMVTFTINQTFTSTPASLTSLGVYVLQAAPYTPQYRLMITDQEEDEMELRWTNQKDIWTLDLVLDGYFVIIPCTELPEAGRQISASLFITTMNSRKTSEQLPIKKLNNDWQSVSEHGRWSPETPGGLWGTRHFIHNPQYRMKFAQEALITIVLSAAELPPGGKIGFYAVDSDPDFATVTELQVANISFQSFEKRHEIIAILHCPAGLCLNILPLTGTPVSQSSYPYTLTVYSTQACKLELVSRAGRTFILEHNGHWVCDTSAKTRSQVLRQSDQLLATVPINVLNTRLSISMFVWPDTSANHDINTLVGLNDDASRAALSSLVLQKSAPPSPAHRRVNSNLVRSSSSSSSSESPDTKKALISDIKDFKRSFGFCLALCASNNPEDKRVLIADADIIHQSTGELSFISSDIDFQRLRQALTDAYQTELKTEPTHLQFLIIPFYESSLLSTHRFRIQLILQTPSDPSTHIPSMIQLPSLPHLLRFGEEWAIPTDEALTEGSDSTSCASTSTSNSNLPCAIHEELLMRSSMILVNIPKAQRSRLVAYVPTATPTVLVLYKIPSDVTWPASSKASRKSEVEILKLCSPSKIRRPTPGASEVVLTKNFNQVGKYVLCALPETAESEGWVNISIEYVNLTLTRLATPEPQHVEMRRKAIEEIRNTEEKYLTDLAKLQNLHKVMRTNLKTLNRTEEQVAALFNGLDKIAHLSTMLLKLLQYDIANGLCPRVSEIFEFFEPCLTTYSNFCFYHPANNLEFVHLCRRDAFLKLLTKAGFKEGPNELNSTYAAPAQRSMRYLLLLEQLHKVTGQHGPDAPRLASLCMRFKAKTAELNQIINNWDGLQLLPKIKHPTKNKHIAWNEESQFCCSSKGTLLHLVATSPASASSPSCTIDFMYPKSSKNVSKDGFHERIQTLTCEQLQSVNFIILIKGRFLMLRLKETKLRLWPAIKATSEVAAEGAHCLKFRTLVSGSIVVFIIKFDGSSQRDIWLTAVQKQIVEAKNQPAPSAPPAPSSRGQ